MKLKSTAECQLQNNKLADVKNEIAKKERESTDKDT